MSEARKIISEAADLLESHGWCQGHYHVDVNGEIMLWDEPAKEGDCFCMMGAINHILSKNKDNYHVPYNLISTHLCNKLQDKGLAHSPMGFNDHPDRTKKEVVAFMRSAVARDTEFASCPI